MVNAWNLFVGRCFILLLLATSGGTEAPPTSWSKNQEILSLIINETFSSNNFTTSHSSCPDNNSRNVSAFWKNQCSVNNGMVGRHSTEKDSRIGCCQPNYVTYLYDVKIEGGKFLLYHSNSPAEPSKLRVSKHKLPPMTSMMMQIRHEFNMDVEERYSSDGRPTHCSSIFPGTLHVVGRSTVNNVYHASK